MTPMFVVLATRMLQADGVISVSVILNKKKCFNRTVLNKRLLKNGLKSVDSI